MLFYLLFFKDVCIVYIVYSVLYTIYILSIKYPLLTPPIPPRMERGTSGIPHPTPATWTLSQFHLGWKEVIWASIALTWLMSNNQQLMDMEASAPLSLVPVHLIMTHYIITFIVEYTT